MLLQSISFHLDVTNAIDDHGKYLSLTCTDFDDVFLLPEADLHRAVWGQFQTRGLMGETHSKSLPQRRTEDASFELFVPVRN
eukprot:s180_g42.t1